MTTTEINRLPASAAVIGLGDTGLSCIRYLVRRGVGVHAFDTRQSPPALAAVRRHYPQVEVTCGALSAPLLSRSELVVVSPGVSIDEPALQDAVAAGVDVAGDVELFARESRRPVIGVTGSNGKSTVTELVGRMCRRGGIDASVGGNIGRPVLDLLDEDTTCAAYVVELSSFQLESTTSLRCAASTILNLSADHLDRHGDLETYFAAKQRIYEGTGTAVINRDDPRLRALIGAWPRRVSFGSDSPPGETDYGLVADKDGSWLCRGTTRLLATRALRLVGRHNQLNVMAACALADCLGVSDEAKVDAASDFRGLPHRMEVVAERDHLVWVNDSKATNVGATVAALEGIARAVILIAGGDGKGADFSPLADAIARYAREVVLIGRDGPSIAAQIRGRVPVCYAEDMADAVRRARSKAGPGDVVLLAPACASFDMFDNYQARGEAFRAAVAALS